MRRQIVEMITAAKSAHPGGSLSAVEILVTLFFGGALRHNPSDPHWPDRDRFILSKGHAAPVYYSVLAQAGYTQGHPDVRFIPALEASAGSLGQGLSIGLGMALPKSWTTAPAVPGSSLAMVRVAPSQEELEKSLQQIG